MQQSDLEIGIILLIVPTVLLLWVYYGKRSALERFLARLPEWRYRDVYGALYEYLAAFALMFVVPCLVVVFAFGRDLGNYGVQRGDIRLGARVLALGLPLALLVAWIGSADAEMQTEYPLAKSVKERPGLFAITEAAYLVYYVGWEFLFRGVMLFALYQRYGAVLAVSVQTIPSAIVHIGKPASESFAAIVAGVLFGCIALETQSIIYPLALHAALGISTDVFVTLRTRRALG